MLLRCLPLLILLVSWSGPNVLAQVNDGDLAKLVFEKGEEYELERNWSSALDYYMKALDLSKDELHYYKAGYAATQCRPPRWETAEQLLRHCRALNGMVLLATAYQGQRQWQAARKALDRAERLAPDNPQLLLAKGRWGYGHWRHSSLREDADLAIQSYRDYLFRQPNSPYRGEAERCLRELEHGQAGELLNIAIAVFRTRDFERSWLLLDDALKLEPGWKELAYWRGQIQAATSDSNPYHDPTGKQPELSWQQAKPLPGAHLALARWYWEQGQVMHAQEEAENAVIAASDWAPPLLLLGEILISLGDEQLANEYLQQVIDQAPNSIEAERARHLLDEPARPNLIQTALKPFIETYGPQVQNAKQQRRLEGIIARIYEAHGFWGTLPHIQLLASQTRNAWSMPPNNLYVTMGLLEFVDTYPALKPVSNDVLAFVLGHEWTHILQSDYERSEKVQRLIHELTSQQSVTWQRVRSSLGHAAEFNADRQGLLFAYRAGYDPYAAIRWCEATIQEEGDWDGNGDHPSMRARQHALEAFLGGSMLQAYESFEEGVRTFQSNNLEQASREFEAYLQLFPNDTAALENLSIVYFLRGARLYAPWSPWRLVHDIRQTPTSQPWIIPKFTAADIAEARFWWQRAEWQANLLLRLDPEAPGAYQILGDIYLATEEWQQAKDMYAKGLAIAPSHRGLSNNLGALHAVRSLPGQAQALWESLSDSPEREWNLKRLQEGGY